MILYSWKIKSYAYLVKIGRYDLEQVEENYREAVAMYLATGEIVA